jgi:hypothetical protein
LQDEKIDELEKRIAKKSVEEKEWWDKDGEEGYTSEYDHIDWDWDNTVWIMTRVINRMEMVINRMEQMRRERKTKETVVIPIKNKVARK